MSERSKFIIELSQRILGNIISSALAHGNELDPKVAAELAVKAAGALFDQLGEDGHLGA